jgi:type VI secretion system secreted protein VgrG
MIIRTKSESDDTIKIGSLPTDKLKLVSFSASEGVSELFSVSVDLASRDGQIDFDAIIGQPALLTIHGPKGKRYLHGMVSLLEMDEKNGPWAQYRAQIVPTIRLLSYRYNCRIFQSKSIPDIIKQVLLDGDIPSDQFRFSLKKDYKPRDYCVQYRESDLAFITRLMEQYGLFYFFEHSADNHKLVIGDSSDVHLVIADPPKIIYHAPGGTGVADQEHVYDYNYQQEIRSDGVCLRDFDFKKPKLNLTQETGEKKREVYDYPGEYVEPSEGGALAKVRLEDLQATRRVGLGQSDCRRLIPGFRFTLDEHSRSDFNREYLLLKVSQSGSQPQVLGAEAGGGETSYQNQFECIPSDVPFRSPRNTGKPIVQGPQTAIVVGPGGEEIYTDEYGRVKVQFHWDREGKQDEKSSCWIRVSQVWAGANWGAMYIPRIGQEVLVSFLEGDPDQPIITGRVYNGEQMPPYDLPAEKTKSTIKSDSSLGGGGSNEFRFEDKKGDEEIYLHGQKDWTILIENDKNQKVGHDETLDVGNDRTKNVVKNQSETIGENKTISVGKNHTESIGENASIDVGKDETISIGKNQTISIGENMTLTVGKNRSESIGNNEDLSVGKNQSISIGENLSAQVGKKGTLQIGDDLGVTVDKKLNIQAADQINILSDKQIVLKTGDASITLKKNGDITIKGKKINVNASGDLVMKGSKITQN